MITNENPVLTYSIDGLIQINLMDDQRVELGKEWCEKLECFDGKIAEEVIREQYLREHAQEIIDAYNDDLFKIAVSVEIKLNVALKAYGKACAPLMPPTDYELIAYVDGLQKGLVCDDAVSGMSFTKGWTYPVRTEFFEYSEKFVVNRPYYDEKTKSYLKKKHRISRKGKDRAIVVRDDFGEENYFLEKPTLFPTSRLPSNGQYRLHDIDCMWLAFQRPKISTVKETLRETYDDVINRLEVYEMMCGFEYYEGQRDFIARMACRDFGIVGAACGCGKSLMAITLMKVKEDALKILLIAPASTVTSGNGYTPAQWAQEFADFAPDINTFELFSFDHYELLKKRYKGKLPPGVYITYPEAMFTSGAREYLPQTWKEEGRKDPWLVERKFRKIMKMPPVDEDNLIHEEQYHKGLGQTCGEGEILCVAKPSLSSVVSQEQGDFDMIVLDEAHTVAANIKSQRGRAFLRMQSKYRYCLSATPIPNNIGDLFGIMGWVTVPKWYRGNKRSVSFHYSIEQKGNFESAYLTYEDDLTATMRASVKYVKGRQRRVRRRSNIVSQPTSLLKLLKPTIGYVDKSDCRNDMPKCIINEVRVPLGQIQARAYHIAKSMARGAFARYSQLRQVCADPSAYGSPPENPKTMTVLQLALQCLEKHEQVVIVSARHGMTNALEEKFWESGVTTSRLVGSMSSRMQSQESQDFKDQRTQIMLMGIKCAMGHSYPQCPNLICTSLEWSYGTKEQAFGRVFRVNSPKTVNIWCVLHAESIEDTMFSRVSDKQESALLCLHGKRMTRTPKFSTPEDILAEHLIDYAAGETIDEQVCIREWPSLRTKLADAAQIFAPTLA